ncbi:SlyX family protein [Tropicimonas sp. IMCC6043]|uniref:SlyX family protein n=1 Tax=Tropicimonas sp. IMCC6043 TaxID=2510645 RepID=UPI00101D8BF6|nr:SlyX family protein [Tropicimonas sp. IMCC6043]RYH10088.1 SlyX family protein [Tropicimonas sp. IMCC6043]
MSDQKIEEELAHLRRVTEELSDVVARQADEIDRLARHLRLLMARAAEQEAAETGGTVFADERPPHY